MFSDNNQALISLLDSMYNNHKLTFKVMSAQTNQDYAWCIISDALHDQKYCLIRREHTGMYNVTFITQPVLSNIDANRLSYKTTLGESSLVEYLKKNFLMVLPPTVFPIGQACSILAKEYLTAIEAPMTIENEKIVLSYASFEVIFDSNGICSIKDFRGTIGEYQLNVENAPLIRTLIATATVI